MATTTFTDQFKIDRDNGGHNFKASGGLAYKLLLIKAGATGAYDKTLTNVGTPGTSAPTTANVGTDEATSSGYTSGGLALTNVSAVLSSDTSVVTFGADPSWAAVTFSVIAAVLYTTDSTLGAAGRTVAIFDFGGTQTLAAATFTLTRPVANSSTGLLRTV